MRYSEAINSKRAIRTAEAIEATRAEISRLARQRSEWNILGQSNWDQDADIAAQIRELEGELEALEYPELYG